MEVFNCKGQTWEGTYNTQTESEPFFLIKVNSFNREKSNNVKNFVLRIEGWAVFIFQLLIFECR